jgi:peptidyl-prolyl cis-trans isomerase C
MKKFAIFGALALLAGLAAAGAAGAADEDKKAADSGSIVIARVNGKSIDRGEFERNWPAFLQSKGVPPDHAGQAEGKMGELKEELLGLLIDQEIMFQAAVSGGHEVSGEDVDAELKNMMVRSGIPSMEALAEALGKNGVTVEHYKNFISRRLTVNNLILKDIAETVVVGEEEIKDFYEKNKERMAQPEQVRARHILIKLEQGADEAAKAEALKRIEEVIAKAKAGEDFAELAKQFSEGPSGPKGGDLGPFTRGRMVPPFEEAAFKLGVGEISGPVLTRFGYHAIKVEEKVEKKVPSLEESREQVTGMLKNTKVSEAVEVRLEKLRSEAKIEKLL